MENMKERVAATVVLSSWRPGLQMSVQAQQGSLVQQCAAGADSVPDAKWHNRLHWLAQATANVILVFQTLQAWGYDAHMWRPDRWLEGRSVTANKLDSNGLKRHIPFSDGPQNCIGSHLATVRAPTNVLLQLHDSRRMHVDTLWGLVHGI